jgi:hypothetical protein
MDASQHLLQCEKVTESTVRAREFLLERMMETANEIQVQQFVKNSKTILKPYLREYGIVLYSHRNTLC